LSDPDNIPREPFAVFCGLDVGKSEHHACALDPAGKRLHDKALPNDETALSALFTALSTHGRVLVVVDQPASIGALAVAVARTMGVEVADLPGLAMRRIADLHPGPGQDRRPRRAHHRRRRPDHAPHAAPGRDRR